MFRFIFSGFLLIISFVARAQHKERTIWFRGYEWSVRNTIGKQGPGPNYFSDSCVRIDASGRLHLWIKKDIASGQWRCPEVTTSVSFGYGTYQFVVEGPIDHFDKNIVLGLFNYSGDDGFDEMDIEIARWGNGAYPNLNYTIWPEKKDSLKHSSITREFTLKSGMSTHIFRRTADTVICSSFDGISTDPKDLIFSSLFTRPAVSISQLAMPVHINFWLFNGDPPLDQQPVELIIRNFQFIPTGHK
jgi:hypothetical protein